MHVSSTKQNVSISLVEENGKISVASADNLLDGRWWISRVNVQGERGKGTGSKLLTKLILEVLKHGKTDIVVAPGGYNEDEEKQFNFYKKNNFIETEEPKLLKYNVKTDLIKDDCRHYPDCIMLMDNGICGNCIFYSTEKPSRNKNKTE